MQISYKQVFLLLLSCFGSGVAISQTPVGTWRDHLPYNSGRVVAVSDDKVYCATDLALFYYEKNDDAIYKLSKINKLSDLDVGYIAYSDKYNKLIIGYKNGNIDIMEGDTKYNFPDIKMKNIIADKSIYQILIIDDLAYISTGFGIVVFNLKKNEFADTYIIGEGGSYLKINSTAIYNNDIYALTDNGVKKCNLDNPFLGNFENWIKVEEMLNPTEKYYASVVFNNVLLLVNNINNSDSCHVNRYNGQTWDTLFTDRKNIKSITTNTSALTLVDKNFIDIYDANFETMYQYPAHFSQHAIFDKNNNLWIADLYSGLKHYSKDVFIKSYIPNGPESKEVFKVFDNNGVVLVAPGGYENTGSSTFKLVDVYDYNDEQWNSIRKDKENYSKIKSMSGAVDFASQNRSNQYILGTWYYGLVEVEDNKVINTFNSENTDSILGNVIGGLTYDNYGNLYVTCNYTQYPFVVKTPDNKWYHYQYDPLWADTRINSSRKLINTYNNDKWTISSRGKGIFVWNDNATPEIGSDDAYRMFNLTDESDAIIDTRLNDIVQDVEGAIWIATGNGIAVYDYPEYAINDDNNFYARIPQIVVEGFLKGLLEGENVTTIAVDGANRKWLGTEGGGLFLVSPDGTEQLMVWNTDNSKLFSNNIISLDINQLTGEVFIGTDKGLQSYKGTSTQGKDNYTDIYAFPNPVKGDYSGTITIRGLMYQTQVKITDISGRKVFETTSNGGDAIWNGKDLTGNKVSTGIYLVMCTLPDGTESEVTKILIVK